ncbi:hypothetical protein BJ912DRAFT_1064289 [Pholiota molesta]|nr:hypothetical protein BJ912DRAFT_1064289 [Pholiota molesta]
MAISIAIATAVRTRRHGEGRRIPATPLQRLSGASSRRRQRARASTTTMASMRGIGYDNGAPARAQRPRARVLRSDPNERATTAGRPVTPRELTSQHATTSADLSATSASADTSMTRAGTSNAGKPVIPLAVGRPVTGDCDESAWVGRQRRVGRASATSTARARARARRDSKHGRGYDEQVRYEHVRRERGHRHGRRGSVSAGTGMASVSAGTDVASVSAGTDVASVSAGTDVASVSAGTDVASVSAGTDVASASV